MPELTTSAAPPIVGTLPPIWTTAGVAGVVNQHPTIPARTITVPSVIGQGKPVPPSASSRRPVVHMETKRDPGFVDPAGPMVPVIHLSSGTVAAIIMGCLLFVFGTLAIFYCMFKVRKVGHRNIQNLCNVAVNVSDLTFFRSRLISAWLQSAPKIQLFSTVFCRVSSLPGKRL
jgi:hypothetical protein